MPPSFVALLRIVCLVASTLPATPFFGPPTKTIPLLPVPLVRQSKDYTCGPSATKALFAYHGDQFEEAELEQAMKCNSAQGTSVHAIQKFAAERGYLTQSLVEMPLDQLRRHMVQGDPVLVLLQAWSETPKNYADAWEDGHYAVVVAFDQRNLYFMDPSTDGHYTYIPTDEFLQRWHDSDGSERLNHFGMVLRRNRAAATAVKSQPPLCPNRRSAEVQSASEPRLVRFRIGKYSRLCAVLKMR